MNAYCDLVQFRLAYDTRSISETSDDLAAASQDDETVQFNLDTAASELDSVLTGKYGLPLPTVPHFLTHLVATLAIRNMYGRRMALPEGLKPAIDRAEKWLENITLGKVGIPGVDRASTINVCREYIPIPGDIRLSSGRYVRGY